MATRLVQPSQEARRARWAVFALFFTNGALFANVIPRYPEIKDIFGLSDSWYGVTIALFPLGAVSAGPLAARLIRRFTSARAATLGTAGIGAALVLVGAIAVWRESLGAGGGYASPWSHGGVQAVVYVLFAIVFFLGGASDSITDVGQNAHGLRVQRHYGRSIINTFHGGWSLGAVTGGLIGAGAVQLDISLGWHLMCAAALFIVVGLVAYRFTLPGPDEDRSAPRSEPGTKAEMSADAAATEEPGIGVDQGAAFADAVGGAETQSGGNDAPTEMRVGTLPLKAGVVVAMLTVLAISGTLVEDAASTWSSLYMRDFLGLTGGLVGMGYVALLGSQAVGRLFADRVTDALGPRGIVLLGGAMVTVGMGTAVLWPHLGTTLVGMVLAGAGCAAIVPLAMNAADDIPGMRAGTGLTIISWLMRTAFLFSPPIVGMIVEATSLRASMVVLPVAGLLTLASGWVLAPRRRAPSGR